MKEAAALLGLTLVLVVLARLREDVRRIAATQDRLIHIWAKAVELNR